MDNSGKKVAFSFSKVKKPGLVKKVNIEPKEKIDYVDCFDGSKGKFSYKGNIRNDETVKKELVIPMPSKKTSLDIVQSRIEEKLKSSTSSKNEKNESKNDKIDSKNLEELAAIEILNELKNGEVSKDTNSKLVIKSEDLPQDASENDIDYDNIPVTDFGLALLRGMGWKPEQGIGKEPRLVEPSSPKLRPKGLGLGAKPKPETDDVEKKK